MKYICFKCLRGIGETNLQRVTLIWIFNYLWCLFRLAYLIFCWHLLKKCCFSLGPLHILKEIFPSATDDQLKVALEDNLNNVDLTINELLTETNGKYC